MNPSNLRRLLGAEEKKLSNGKEEVRVRIPKTNSRERTVTFYTDKMGFKEALDIANKEKRVEVLSKNFSVWGG